MRGGRRIAVVVPAYDEERLIARTLASVPACVDEIIVVDDASTDGTHDIVRRLVALAEDGRLVLERHAVNRGVGAAIATGYAVAFAHGADVAVVMAGDGQMDPSDLDALIAPILSGDAGYAKGDRLSHSGLAAMPAARRVGNALFSAATRLVTGLSVSDSQCGYTALSREAAGRLELARLWPRYGYPNDLLARCARAGVRVKDVTVRPIYADEESGLGIRDALFVIPKVLARAALTRWRAGEADPAE